MKGCRFGVALKGNGTWYFSFKTVVYGFIQDSSFPVRRYFFNLVP